MQGCPLGINIPGFIRNLREGDVGRAYEVIREQNLFPSICGRVCSAPCEVSCILTDEGSPIGIRALERYCSDNGRSRSSRKDKIYRKGKKIAVVGSGPSGMSAAAQLAQKGYQVTIFESLDAPGGVLRYGIPEFRIPKKILDFEINEIRNLGVDIQTNFFIGQNASLEDLFEQGFVAVLLATGAGTPKFVDLPGSNLGGVYYGEEFLMRVNLIKSTLFSRTTPNFVLGQRIAVIGSGNTALDCARAAKRFGRDVTLIFRRTEDDMRTRRDERDFAKEEGVEFEPLVKPIEILADQNNFVDGLKCVRMDFAESSKDQWELARVPDSEFVLEADTVIIAVGHIPNFLKSMDANNQLNLSSDGTIEVDPKTSQTSIPKVFASGNVVTNAGPIVEAIAGGKQVAERMDRYLKR